MTNVVITIKGRFDGEFRDYIANRVVDGIPVGDFDKLEVKVEFVEEAND